MIVIYKAIHNLQGGNLREFFVRNNHNYNLRAESEMLLPNINSVSYFGSVTLFPGTCAIAHSRAGKNASKFTSAIYHTREIILFSLFFLLLLFISRKENFLSKNFSLNIMYRKLKT